MIAKGPRNKLKICIDARIPDGEKGGIQQFIIGLASGIAHLDNEREAYHFLTLRDSEEWLRPYLDDHCNIISLPPTGQDSKLSSIFFRFPANWLLIRIMAKLSDPLNLLVPKSDRTIERCGMHVMHFTTQNGFLTKIPSIYHPHDLLHLHYPQYLSKLSVTKRDYVYRKLCTQSAMIATASNWVKQDLMHQYRIADHKIAVVPLAPLLDSYPAPSAKDLAATKQKFSLPDQFVYYPAQTWPHKNHIGLLRALGLLRDQKNLRLAFVSSGKQNDHYPNIRKAVADLNLEDQVVFLGYVSPLEVSCLYKLSHCVVIPTKFEAASFPLWEAFQAGVPVACSNATSLPGQAGDAALVFDPENTDQMAESIWRIVVDTHLRHQLISNATRKIQNYSWDKTARRFRSLYRIIGGTSTSEDTPMLNEYGAD